MSRINDEPLDSQNFWELTSIQIASIGVLGVIFGWQLKNQFGAGNAIVAICIGNLIQWLVGIGIVKMSFRNRSDAIQNAQKYLGKGSAIGAILVFIIVFLIWFAYQLKAGIQGIVSILPAKVEYRNTEMWGITLGLCASFLASKGIRVIKRLSVCFLPILIILQIYALQIVGAETSISWEFSLPAVGNVVFLNMIGVVNLPTFFKHSRSAADSILSLTVIFFLNIFVQFSSVLIHFDLIAPVFLRGNAILNVLLILLVVFLIIINLLRNIYFASACCKIFSFQYARFLNEYSILGLIGIFAFVLIPNSTAVIFVKDLTTGFIINLGFVLLTTYMVRLTIKRNSSIFGKIAGSASWLIGCIAVTILIIQNPDQRTQNLFSSLGINALFYLSIIYIAIAIWSVKRLLKSKYLITIGDQ